MALNDMEIRNCLYRGKLNTLLRELSDDADFKGCISQRGLDRRMEDRMLVLRFLAFYQMTYSKAKKGLKTFFNEFFSTYRDPSDSKLREFRTAFRKAMKCCHSVFGDKGFRLRRNMEKGGGEWTPRINASVFQVIAVSMTDYDQGQITRASDSIFEAYVDLVSVDERWVEAVSLSTGDSNKIEYSFLKWNEILKLAIGETPANDKKRCFSRQLKEELFAQSDACHLCKQKITLLNDAALDHEIQYWRGGKTIPSNARLVHRICNLKRPRKE
jgi:hypothetical protein